jgi:hypothetical protein
VSVIFGQICSRRVAWHSRDQHGVLSQHPPRGEGIYRDRDVDLCLEYSMLPMFDINFGYGANKQKRGNR